jgi:polyketide biosynthesis enoyl-CoA hydratase PksI
MSAAVSSNVVTVDQRGGVATVRMTDVSQSNALTSALSSGLATAFAHAGDEPSIRAIVLAGLPEVFNSGATQDMMRDVLDGRRTAVNADEVVQSPARSALPVVAAARGHAIGGGLLLALYSDVVVLSERSCYSVPFVQYGLTPVQGATALLCSRFGELLGGEMLLTGRRYQGRELRRRAAPALVTAHDEVESVAQVVAEQMSRAPRRTLELVKEHLAAPLIARSEQAMQEEQEMLRQVLIEPGTAGRAAAEWRSLASPPGPLRSTQ